MSSGTRKRSEFPGDSPLAILAAKIVEKASDEAAGVSELMELATKDPAFAARVLRAVNCPLLGLSRTVNDVGQAASLIGKQGLRSIALGLLVSDMVPPFEGRNELLALAVRRAAAARALAAALGERRPDEAATVGLLLEIGLLKRARDDQQLVVELVRAPYGERLAREREVGMEGGHAGEGARVARALCLPEVFVEAVRHHHDEEPSGSRLAQIGWAAERMAAVYECRDIAAAREEALQACGRLGLDRDQGVGLLEALPGQVAEYADGLEIDVGPQADLDEMLWRAARSLTELNREYQRTVMELRRVLAEKEELQKELERQASTDLLTGLFNRRAFVQTVERDLGLAERGDRNLAVIMMDVDHFKQVNDTHGHDVGDQVLVAVADVLRRCVRGTDVPARWGGEEFIVALPDCDAEDALVVAERIRATLEQTPVLTANGALAVTASFGVAGWDPNLGQPDLEAVVKRADQALYAAKRGGRNRVEVAA